MSGTHPGLVPDYRTGLRTGRRLPDWLQTGSAQNSAELFFSEIPHVSGLGSGLVTVWKKNTSLETGIPD